MTNLSKLINLFNNKFIHFLLLISIFTLIYIPHAFLMNESIETIAAFEIDGSLMIDSVFQHLDSYNLQLGYMSRFYGWSYFFINYILLKPAESFTGILLPEISISVRIFLIKIVYFTISLSSLVAFYVLLSKAIRNNLIAFLLSFVYLFPALKFNLFVDVKPETTGLLFLFLSQISLLNFIQDKKSQMKFWFISGLISAVFSVMAKQSFVFVTVPIFVLYYWYFTKRNGFHFFKFLVDTRLLSIAVKSFLLILTTIAVVYPHIFVDPAQFLADQLTLIKDHGSDGTLSLKGMPLIMAWIQAIWSNAFLRITSLLWLPALLLSIKLKSRLRMFYITTILSIPPIVFIICKNSGLFIDVNYLHPLLSYFVISASVPVVLVFEHLNRIMRISVTIILTYFFLFVTAYNVYYVNLTLSERADYRNSTVMKVSDFIKDHIPSGSRLAISQGVLIPNDGNAEYSYCHWWNSCSLLTQLEEFEPDFLIYINNESYNGITPDNYLAFIEYIDANDYKFVESIGKFVVYKK